MPECNKVLSILNYKVIKIDEFSIATKLIL